MNKDKIKVVKRNIKDGGEKPQVVFKTPKVESDTPLKIANVVNNWISERRENKRAEKVYSDSRISAWKVMSGNF